MKTISILPVIFLLTGPVLAAANVEFPVQDVEERTGQLVRQIDSVFASLSGSLTDKGNLYFDEVALSKGKAAMRNFLATVEESDMTEIHRHYGEKLLAADEKAHAAGELLQTAYLYLMSGAPGEELAHYECVVGYGETFDTFGINRALERYRAWSALNDGKFDEIISYLEQEYRYVIDPGRLNELYSGWWVSASQYCDGKRVFPWSIIAIEDFRDGVGTVNNPGEARRPYESSSMPLILIGSKATPETLELSFGSEQLDRGNAGAAAQGFEMTRQITANAMGTLNTADIGLGTYMGATVAVGAFGVLMNYAFMSMAESQKNVRAWNLTLNRTSDIEMKGGYEFIDYTASTGGTTKRNDASGEISYVKWEEGDDVYFVNYKKDVIKLPSGNVDLSEYEAIRYKYSMRNPEVLWPVLGSGLACIGLLTAGVLHFSTSDNPNEALGMTLVCIGGYGLSLIIPITTAAVLKNKRNKAFNELNTRNMEKLQRKAATLSISPAIGVSGQSTLGISAQITF